MKNYGKKITAVIFCVAVLIFAFMWGEDGDLSETNGGETAATEQSVSTGFVFDEKEKNDGIVTENDEIKSEEEPLSKNRESEEKYSNETEITEADKYKTETESEEVPVPAESDNVNNSEKKMTCTMSVTCDTILKNIDKLNKEKLELIPKDGVIFAEKTVDFYEGESVFNLLGREMKKNKIHMEFESTPIYNSTYIEGIANIYEFDCGELSGWMYKVNGSFPNYGCSKYQLKQGDRVEWVYTCDMGRDVGEENSFGGQRK